ncbi:MAG: hypothetical protein IT371_12910 [Deltaproteobacteria bacterium]|nr:hypothetical protein [Deltaproteobacteria bacterium]
MPCGDVSEYLELRLDDEERLAAFSLAKDTCGAPVGNAQLLEHLRGRRVEELLDRSLEELLPDAAAVRPLDRFLLGKQLAGLQAALEVYLGRSSGAKNERFAVESIVFTEEGSKLSGLLRVDIPPAEVPACGGCGGRAH